MQVFRPATLLKRDSNTDVFNNGIRNHNHLVPKRTLNHVAKLAKWLSCVISTYLCTVCYYHVTYEFQSESTFYSLHECLGTLCSKQAPYSNQTSDMAPASSKEFLDIHANYRVHIQPETRTWHDNNIQSLMFSHEICEILRIRYNFI